MLLLALLSNGCATKELWEQKAFREPSSPTHLKLAFDAARKDVLVVYDEINDRADVPQRRAYYLFQNVRRIERDRKPSFTDPGRAGSLPEIVVAGPGPFMPAQEQLDYCAKASTNSASFQLYAKGRQVGEFYLPVYKDGVWETQKALLTPLTLGADATVIGGVLGAMWISEGAPGAVH